MACLFRALGKLEGESAETMRARICDALEADPVLAHGRRASEWVRELEDVPLDRYVQYMRRPLSWGGGIEIQTYAVAWGRRVLVHHPWGRRIEFIDHGDVERHLDWTGNHYEPRTRP